MSPSSGAVFGGSCLEVGDAFAEDLIVARPRVEHQFLDRVRGPADGLTEGGCIPELGIVPKDDIGEDEQNHDYEDDVSKGEP